MDNKLLAHLRRWQLAVWLNCLFWLVMVGVGAWFGFEAMKERHQAAVAWYTKAPCATCQPTCSKRLSGPISCFG